MLSYGQRRIWFFEQWHPGTPTYNVANAYWVRGRLDPATLSQALGVLADRHETLRTRYLTLDDEPFQVVETLASIPLSVHDVAESASKGWDVAATAMAERVAREPFDLRGGPPFRVALVQGPGERQLLVIVVHHIALDGISFDILLDELRRVYDAVSAARPTELGAPAVRYIDFCVWERERWEAGGLAEQTDYWRQRLVGAPEVLDLPTDRPRPQTQTFTGATRAFPVPPALDRRLRMLAVESGVSPFVAYLAAFNVLLLRFTGVENLVVGTPVATRGRSELEGLVGVLLNLLPLRVDLSGEPDFHEVLRRVAGSTTMAFAHQDVPFERLVAETGVRRQLSHSPIVQTVFGMQPAPLARLSMGGATLVRAELDRGTAKFDMTWTVLDGDRVCCEVEYNADLFDADSVDRMLDCYLRLIEAVVTAPHAPVTRVPMYPPPARSGRSNPTTEVPAEAPAVPALVARWARETPDAVAVTCGDERVTYAALDERARRLADLLRARGAVPGETVGICLPRGVELVVAILAAWRIRCAYLALDPEYPPGRLAYLLGDSRIRLIVAGPEAADRIPEGDWTLLTSRQGPAQPPSGAPPVTDPGGARPGDVAYLIYTSGSTGSPKAVEVTHHNVARLFSSVRGLFDFGERDVWTMFHSPSFDFSVWEMWGALAHGGRLVIVPTAVARSAPDFYDLVVAEEVTVLSQTPSAFRQFEGVDAERPGCLALRWITLGGEAVDVASTSRWLRRHGDESPRLVNMYGITETTVHVTHQRLTSEMLGDERSPIGTPLPDLEVHVLDAWGNPLPPGVPGEMYVGGAGVTRGYRNQPALTAERFVPDALSGRAGARLYRTGDLARRRPDGRLEYLGRNDDQVKIRGFRVETGEIATLLARHPRVRGSVVVAARSADGSARLVAYVVAPDVPTLTELRSHLAAGLPEHMIPATFVFLDSLPTTENGKVDLSALPEPASARPELAQGFTEPRNDVESLLARIWSDVLQVDQVGVHDNFFELGGDSILSLRILGRAREHGLGLTLQDLFGEPTVAGMARLARPAERLPGRTSDGPFASLSAEERLRVPEGVEDAYPMSVLQAGMVYHMSMDTDTLPYHNVNSFHVRAPFDAKTFQRAVDDVVARHPILRTGFDLVRYGKPMQLVHRSAHLPVHTQDLRDVPPGEQKRRLLDLMHEERQRPFDPEHPPLLRFFLHRRTADTFQWTVTEHHAIFDGWSLFSTLAEILDRYTTLLGAPDAPAPAPPSSSFRDFIAEEQRAIASAPHREFWRQALADYEPAMLPRWPSTGEQRAGGADAGDTDVRGEDIAGVRHWRLTSTRDASHRGLESLVPAELCDALVSLAARIGVPLKSVLLTAHLKMISLFTGRDDLITGLTSHGRLEESDGTEVRGMFLNVPPLRVRLANGTWADLIRHVYRAEERLLPHRRYPLAQIQWDHGGGELFDNTFLYNHFHVMSDVLGSDVEILDDKIDSTTEYRSEPTSFALNAGFLRNPRTSGLLLRLDYYTARLSDEQALAMRDQYLAILRTLVDAGRPHEEFVPLPDADRQRVLIDWNGPRRTEPVSHCVHELVEEQAERTPDAIAVCDDTRQLTYAQLNAAANRLARHLRSLGARAETVVGVCVPRDAGLLVTLLGILKSGAAYLPLVPDYPAERLRFMLEDANATLVVTTDDLVNRVPDGAWRVITDHRDGEAIDRQATDNLTTVNGPDNLAYIMYTSGSTGTPKGVLVPHRGVANYLVWAREEYASRGTGGAAVFSSYAFDMIVPNVYTPLIMGERVVVLPQDTDPTRLGRRLSEYAPFNFLKLTPSHLALLADTLGPASARRLAATLVVGADAFPGRHLAAWRQLDPDSVLLNEYGPTEASVGNCVYRTGAAAHRDLVPIGRPIPDTTMYVLDAHLRPVPPGMPGELYIGGECVVRGYAGRPALTAERFLPDPFSTTPGARMYRTGDLGRWLPDGSLDFLGRVDDQLKINGFRVEPGEIEAVLAEHPKVRQAVAAGVRSAAHHRTLVGYYVPAQPVSPAELSDYLRSRLPAHLVPTALVPIAEIPVNANGKVDRSALSRPDAMEHARRQEEATNGGAAVRPAPGGTHQAGVAEIWADLLEMEKPETAADFYQLGGNSILAAQLVSRINARFGIRLSMSVMRRARTVEALAQQVAEALQNKEGA
ncbi:non-ribosomal peptide synthetase [Streptomyces sp. 8K308]|uniref:non-ribosomal peptide synthetase n=1 Tax=Streptomyces sp. 8K308 TaxID=2530388 RepID=UPI0014042821|nr:non-ribosomal peptide synthetase [Streptomyces sp. 8K308]